MAHRPLTRLLPLLLAGLAPLVASAEEPGSAWREALAEAERERMPIVVLYRPTGCSRCDEFHRSVLLHPTVQRRGRVAIVSTIPAPPGERAALALFDRTGRLRARWPLVPDATNFGILLDSIAAVAPHLERAAELLESGSAAEGELEAAAAIARLGFPREARLALARAREGGKETRQRAEIMDALIEAREGQPAEAMARLEALAANAATPKIAATANAALERVRGPAPPRSSGAIRLILPSRQIVSGQEIVRTHVVSPDVARVVFSFDGREVASESRPPFSATLDFGPVPERRVVSVTAYDRGGRQVGRDERVVNAAGETFWIRLVSPRQTKVSGTVRVAMSVRTPAGRNVQRLVVSWNEAERAVLIASPWEASVTIPQGQVGVLRAVAELDDGRTTEDAVLLNAGEFAGRADVHLVQIPITLAETPASPITPERIAIQEGGKTRRVESVATAGDAPLTVGLVIDTSDSMHSAMADLQEAAIRFLETALGERDRAFLITFDSEARLVQPATSNIGALRDQVMRVRPDGLTALYDAIVLGLLQFEGTRGRRAMIVFTDGEDLSSRYSGGDAADLARRVHVPIHVISAHLQSSPAAADLTPIATATGGTAHRLTGLAELPAVYARIEAALRNQILAFIRTDPATRENEWRPVKVEVQGVRAHAPEGYYAAW